MKTKFALPTQRDLRFERYSGLRASDFGEEVEVVDHWINAAVVAAIALFAVTWVLLP